MELEFDKEIDAILRKARSEPSAVADGLTSQPHLDADEISAFAENALPELAKQRYTVHFADCNMCRKKLSSLILLNAEAGIENVHAEEIVPISSAIPWYRKLFAFPNLAYTMGALVLLFSGIIGFTILQNLNSSQNFEVSQSSERPNDTKEKASDDVAAMPETSSSNVANTNLSTNTAVVDSSKERSNVTANTVSPTLEPKPTPQNPIILPIATPRDETPREDDLKSAKDQNDAMADSVSTGSVSEEKQVVKREAEKNKESVRRSETAALAKPAPVPPKTAQPSVSDNKIKSDTPSAKKARQNSELNIETTIVSGKTFNRQNNVWYDSAYNGQSTTNITRGTNEYKKLDKDLRVIVENLGGKVVVVWKEKAYRIR